MNHLWAGSNSGIVCTGVDASGLERSLIRDSISRLRTFCRLMNVPMRACGSLVCKWPWDESAADQNVSLADVLADSHDAGDTHAACLSRSEVLSLEPNLNKDCLGAVLIPGEIVLDPWLFSIAHAVMAVENGAHIHTGFAADMEASSFENNIWTIINGTSKQSSSKPSHVRARAVVNATGVWADMVESSAVGEAAWSARPRRGQYLILKASHNTRITRPIQPVPTQRTKGIFVFSSIYDHIVVGPTALDQESRVDRQPDPAVTEELARYGKQIVPQLKSSSSMMREYVGIRPGTDKRDYSIQAKHNKNWIACAGIRSTGLTASLGIARHVLYLLHQGILQPKALSSDNIRITPLPPVEELCRQFKARNDGHVSIHGVDYKVTHPLTLAGWEEMAASGI